MKSKSPRGQFSDAALKIIARMFKRGANELNLGIPGWRWFQFDPKIDERNFYVSDSGEVRAGVNFNKAKSIRV